MLPKNTTRVEITKVQLHMLRAERERTMLGCSSLLRYARNVGFISKDSRLSTVVIQGWLLGRSSSAFKHEIDAILKAYASVRTETTQEALPLDLQLILVDEKLRQEIKQRLNAYRFSVRQRVLKRCNPPKGLTENRIVRLTAGRDAHIQANHLRFIREHFQEPETAN